MKIRIRYRRWGVMKYLGHLDMMRYFQRAIRRAGIDITYSAGFSPHPVMSFASPLGVGAITDGDYFDIEVNTTFSTEEALRRLNGAMVDGVQVTGYVALPDNAKAAMSMVAAADYRLTWKEGKTSPFSTEEWMQVLQEKFLKQEEFLITVKTKKNEKQVDLKKLVYQIAVEEEKGSPVFCLQVSTGSTDNLKPELVVASLGKAAGVTVEEAALQIHRLETYTRENDMLIPLLATGEEIAG